tara:strand:+ start:759 stop:977 length:219 start_codon:yes stop_codon:yes gene_type:complete
MSVVKNARWIIAESDPMKQVEIVFDDIPCKYASSSDDDGWSDLQAWVNSGNTIIAWSKEASSTPDFITSSRS